MSAQTMFETRTAQLDDLLDLTCEELQLPPSWHALADDRYQAVCAWLDAPESMLRPLRLSLYPQGSFRIGTTVRPIGRDEFDLDLVCEFSVDCTAYSPAAILDLVEGRLRANAVYRPMVERLKRCVRLTYAKQFHLDILPACPEVPRAGTAIRIPDRHLQRWLPSNPKGFATWFAARSHMGLITLTRKAEPVPEHESADEKTPLQRAVQLWKRWRDRSFRKDLDRAPRSIVLTTLAGESFTGATSTSEAFAGIVRGVLERINGTMGILEVRNPANRNELLSERWVKDPESYLWFAGELRELDRTWQGVVSENGAESAALLEALFGEETKRAFTRQAERVTAARSNSLLRSSVSLGALTTAGRGIAVRPNTFHGDPPPAR